MTRISPLFVLLLFLSTGILAQKQLDSLQLIATHPLADSLRVRALLDLAALYRDRNMPLAIACAEKAIQLSELKNLGFYTARSYYYYGFLFNIQGNFPKASKYFHKAVDLLDTLPDTRSRALRLFILHDSGGWMTPLIVDEKVSYLKQSLAVGCHTQEYFLTGNTCTQLGSNYSGMYYTYNNKAYIDSALYYNDLAGEFYKKANFIDGPGKVMANKAVCMVYLGNVGLAEQLFRKAMKLNKKNNCLAGTAHSMGNIGDLLKTKGHYDSALWYLQEGKKIMQKVKFFVGETHIADRIIELYEATGQYDKAYVYLSEIAAKKDSIFNMANAGYINELRNDYEKQLKENEIKRMEAETQVGALKLRQNRYTIIGVISGIIILALFCFVYFFYNEKLLRQLKKASQLDDQIKFTLKEKLREAELTAARAQMDPHFVFNSINAIQNLILKENKTDAITYLNDFSKLTRQTLDNASKEAITLAEEIIFLNNYLLLEQLRFNSCFSFSITTENIDMDYDRIPTLLVQPLVENSVRHGLVPKNQKGNVNIHFKKLDEETLCVIVNDDGVGRAAAHHTKGAATTHQSKALHLTELRIQLLNKEKEYDQAYPMQIEDKVNERGEALGTLVTLIIPLSQTHKMVS